MKYKISTFFACLLIILSGCHKDFESTELEISKTVFSAEILQQVQGNILGYIFDENNQPIEGALVQIYGAETLTNKYGVFTFKNSALDKNGTYITARKNGFLLGSDMVYPNKAELNATIKLIRIETNKSFDASDGAVVNITGGGTIEFPQNAIADNNGNTFTGKVIVTAKFLNPTDKDLHALMPGALVGDTKDNKKTVVLGTAGMIAVELREENGQLLNLLKNKKATVTIPALLDSKPNTIPLWYFNESLGRWKEEGIATLIGENYVGEVSHFSFWNCDAPFPLVNVCGKVVYEDGSPAKNTLVSVETDGFYTGFGITDAEGVFCGKMPKGVTLKINIKSRFYCDQPILSKTIGPLEQNTELDKIVLPDQDNFIKLNGNVICDGIAVEDAILMVNIVDQWFPISVKGDGSFNEDLSHFYCDGINEIKVFAYDISTSESSDVESIKVNELKTMSLSVCDTGCPMTASFIMDCVNKKLSVKVENGGGNYKYEWTKGNTTSNVVAFTQNDSIAGTICVTVTDELNSCAKTFCTKYSTQISAFVEGRCSPNLTATVNGGIEPISYKWDNGNTDMSIPNPGQGIFTITVTDAQGCSSVIATQTGSLLKLNPQPISCNKEFYSFQSSGLTQAKIFGSTGQTLTYDKVTGLDKFVTGFNYKMLISNQECEEDVSIRLPQVSGLEVIGNNTSCATCVDGFFMVGTGSDCFECKIGSIKVLGENKIEDFTATNAAKKLPKGQYYIVVEDEISGCYIGIKKVNML
jgi:hypothetical protein